MPRFQFKKIGYTLTSFLLVLAMVLTAYTPALTPKKAEAQYAVVEVGAGSWSDLGSHFENISTALSTGATAVGVNSLWVKEVMDGVLFAAVNLVLQQMSKSIVTWINSGFKGSPAFVTDLKGFMLGIADKVAGEFIWGSKELNFLCSPFKLDIKIALDIQYKKSRGYQTGTQCKLTDVIKNVEGFGNSLSINNWNQWFQVTNQPENNVYGSLLMAQLNMNDKVQKTLGIEQKKLDFGKGFLSKEVCTDFQGRTECSVVTPGTVIEEQLNHSLGSPTRRIEVADEINEIVAALFGQLVQQVFAGAGGLLGLTKSDYGPGSGDYYQRLATAVATTTATSTGGGAADDLVGYAMQIDREERWAALMSEKMVFLNAIEAYKEASCLEGTPLPQPYRGEYAAATSSIANSPTTINRLMQMESEYRASVGQPNASETQGRLSAELAQMRTAGLIHTQTQLQNLIMSLGPIRSGTALTSFKADVDRQCRNYDQP